MNFWNRHIGDIIRDTVSLTMLEDGAYSRLLDQYYQTERPLPLDKKMIYRLARATSAAERKACDFVMESFFQKCEDGYHQKRCDIEIATYQEKQRKAQASANARWSKSEGNANASGDSSSESRNRGENASSNLVRKVGERIPGTTDSSAVETSQSLYLQETGDANASSSHDALDMRTHCEGNAHQTPITNNQNKDLMSGKPDEPAEVLAHLNAKAGRNFQAVPANTKLIAARIREGATVEQLKAVVDAKVVEWLNDPRMEQYLRPATLFNAEKFGQYSGLLGSRVNGSSVESEYADIMRGAL